jgi:hypothetical protein
MGTEQQQAYEKSRDDLRSPTCIYKPYFKKQFILITVAVNKALRANLSQICIIGNAS